MLTKRARAVTIAIVAGAALMITTAGSAALADNSIDGLRVRLSGYQEDPQALSTTGNGQFRVSISRSAQEVTYRLTYANLEGNVTQAHIHLGGRAQSGGIMVFLCTNAGNGPAGTQPCPAVPGTVTGTIVPANIIGPAGQGITAGQFDEFVAAVRNGTAYVNVHSSLYPAGEIRAQLDHH